MIAGSILVLAIVVHYSCMRICEAIEDGNEINQEANDLLAKSLRNE